MIVILTLCLALALGSLLFLWRQLRRMERSLRELNQGSSREPLRLSLLFPPLERLAEQINLLLERQEQARRTLSRREESLRRDIAGLSHDFCTPLTSLSGYLQLIERAGPLPAPADSYLARARSRTRLLDSLVTEYFELSVYDSPDWPPEAPGPVNLSELLSDALLDCSGEFSQRGLHVHAEIPDTPFWILGDAPALQRIVQNLLSNAARYADTRLAVRLAREGETVRLLVENDASRLSEEDASRLFDRFYTRGQYHGAGLGLSVVRTLCQKLGYALSCRHCPPWLTISIAFPPASPGLCGADRGSSGNASPQRGAGSLPG